MKRSGHLILLTLLCVIAVQTATACPVCYGDKNSTMTAGMNNAILVMLGITGFVLSMIVTFFIIMWRRFKRIQKEISEGTFIDELGVLQTKHIKGVEEWNNI